MDSTATTVGDWLQTDWAGYWPDHNLRIMLKSAGTYHKPSVTNGLFYRWAYRIVKPGDVENPVYVEGLYEHQETKHIGVEIDYKGIALELLEIFGGVTEPIPGYTQANDYRAQQIAYRRKLRNRNSGKRRKRK